ncbi:MAG: hypothetical protein LBP58_06890 [Azoarcus sp.]|jgi:hypothetical protein|nr:hypothetical protein [Azoarcus sp.]
MKVTHNDAGSRALAALADEMGKLRLRVGWFESSTYPWAKAQTPVAYVASIHEHGAASKGIPPRPFMRPTAQDNRQKWSRAFTQAITAAAGGHGSIEMAYTLLGEVVRGDIHKQLAAMGSHPEDADVIHHRRRRKNPPPNTATSVLRDTMTLFNTLVASVTRK